MSLLPLLLARRIGPNYALQQLRTVSTTARTNAGYWNKDWRPADEPPTTEEGKRAAAKKYGMIPEDYETYTPDGTGYGDYPKLPLISAQHRDPHELYDYPELKRNFGEPMHVDADMVGEDRWHYNERLVIPMRIQVLTFLSVMSILAILFVGSEYVRVVPTPMMARQMGTDGKTYYSFEFEECE